MKMQEKCGGYRIAAKADSFQNNMKIGTIGSGFIVKNILESVEKIEGISCVAVYSRSQERGRQLADEFQVKKVYTNLDVMCQDPEIDFIYVASPNTLHYEHVKKAGFPGVHVQINDQSWRKWTPNECNRCIERALREAKNYADTYNKVPLITINSWNEWTETSYLEPDNVYGYGYLEAIKRVFVDEK